MRPCAVCDRLFLPKTRHNRFCSKRCQRRSTGRRRQGLPERDRDYDIILEPRPCGVCNETLPLKPTPGPQRVYCSKPCVARAKYRRDHSLPVNDRDYDAFQSAIRGTKAPARRIDAQGYVVLSLNGVRIKEHRQVMERMLDRKLLRHETVHHLNGIRDDNRPENLELWSMSQPYGGRVIDKLSWAKEFLESYGAEVTLPKQIGSQRS